MTEIVGVASELLGLTLFALTASARLDETVRSHRSHSRGLRNLSEELTSLQSVLRSLEETIGQTHDEEFSALKLPLRRCGKACEEFQEANFKVLQSQGRTGLRDWAKLRYMGEDVDGFRRLLAAYKVTINVALAVVHLRKSIATPESIKKLQELVSTAQADLDDRLEIITEKLDIVLAERARDDTHMNELTSLKEERMRAEGYLQNCTQLSSRIQDIRLHTRHDNKLADSGQDEPSPGKTMRDGLDECKTSLAQTVLRLQGDEKQLFARIVQKLATPSIVPDECPDLATWREEWEATRQSMEICAKAHVHCKENAEVVDIHVGDDAVQIIHPSGNNTVPDKIHGTSQRNLESHGLLSDESLRNLMTGLQLSARHDAEKSSLREASSKFTGRYGRGFVLSENSRSTGFAQRKLRLPKSSPFSSSFLGQYSPMHIPTGDIEQVRSVHGTLHREIRLVDDVDDLDALLDPSTYFDKLDKIEQAVQIAGVESVNRLDTKCHVPLHLNTAVLQTWEKENVYPQGRLTFLMQDAMREAVVKVAWLGCLDWNLENTSPVRAGDILRSVGIFWLPTCDVVALYFRIRILIIMMSSGSFVSDIEIPGLDPLSRVLQIKDALTKDHQPLALYQQDLACMSAYIGAPVWTFGKGPSTAPAFLSTSIMDLANIWGPVLTLPSPNDASMLLAVQAEGGILYQSRAHIATLNVATGGEVPMHFIETSPIRESRTLPGKFMISTKDSHNLLPEKFLAFDMNSLLLIGNPTGSLTQIMDVNPNLDVGSGAEQSKMTETIIHNNTCGSNYHKFLDLNLHDLHPVDTYDGIYLPNELQISFAAGQYLTIGAQKTWKKTPAKTFKKRLLQYLSNVNARPDNVRKLLQLELGLEMSFCTQNSKRVALQDALSTAYPDCTEVIRDAYMRGNALSILDLVDELSNTGFNHAKKLQVFVPSTHIPQILEFSSHLPAWSDMLQDTRDSACFGVLSAQCFTYSGTDHTNSGAILESLCSQGKTYPDAQKPILETTVVSSGVPFEVGGIGPGVKLDLGTGFLCFKSFGTSSSLCSYERKRPWQRIFRDTQRLHIRGKENFAPHFNVEHQRLRLDVCIIDK